MCGNEVSSVSSPNSDFYNLVNSQIPSRTVAISIPITMKKTIQLILTILSNFPQ